MLNTIRLIKKLLIVYLIKKIRKTGKVGFEPTVATNYVSFQDWCLKPLGHLPLKRYIKKII